MTFSNWITKALNENDLDGIQSFPKPFLDSGEKQLIEYCLEYYENYGSLPPIKTVRLEAPNGNLFVNDWIDTEQLTKLYSEAKRQCYERVCEEITLAEKAKDKKDYKKLAERLNHLSGFLKTSEIISLDDPSLYEVPTNRYQFKYKSLDQSANSLLGGEVALFVGPPKAKKTWILLDLALDAYVQQDKKVYVTSLELGKKQLQQRLNAMIGKFDPKVFRIGNQSELKNAAVSYEFEKEQIDKITKGKLIIPNRFTATVWDVVKDIKEHKPDIAFIDSIYLFTNENGRPIMDDWGALGNMIAILKNLARELNIQIVVNSQLKRNVGDDPDAEDVAYSYAFVQTCDLVAALTPQDDSGKERTKIDILASRNSGGMIGNSLLEFDWMNCSISEYVPKFLQKMKAP